MRDGKLDRLSIELFGGSQGLNSAFASTQRKVYLRGYKNILTLFDCAYTM
jgi:hypothetical protein